jgi:hypothetical protein
MTTSKSLTNQGVRHYIIIEKLDTKKYLEAIKKHNLLAELIELNPIFKEKYNHCDNHGLTKSSGPGPARNFAWDHSVGNGFSHHWVMDDNINEFYRLNKNKRHRVNSPAFWKAMEDFVFRYKNIAMAGPNYRMFAPSRQKMKPFTTNTRIYSCNLIRNDTPFRWRGRYNEDTIISLDMLKAGWCTVQFNAFLQEKIGTQIQKGGNTDEFYHAEGVAIKGQSYTDTGTLAKSRMMVSVHPDVSKVVRKFNRVHHHVDYSKFKNQKLIRKKELNIECCINNYGMDLKRSNQ